MDRLKTPTDPPAHQAVERALKVLSHLGRYPTGSSLQELSLSLEVPKPTLHRILATMRAAQFAIQLESGGDYFLGPAALEAAFSFQSGLNRRGLLHPLLLEVNQLFDQTCHLARLEGGDVVYVDKVDTSARIRLSSLIGGRNPAHATGVGKAMLAATLDEGDIEDWVAAHGPLVARTDKTATDSATLRATLRTARTTGYAVDDEESEPGLMCVAVHIPLVFDEVSPPLAISMTGLKGQILEIGVERIGATLISLVDGLAYRRSRLPSHQEEE